jgi:hypothetical protein
MFIAVCLVTGEESVGPTSLYSFTTGYCYRVVSHKVSHATATFLGARQKVYADNPHTLDELKQSTHETITCTKVSELQLMSNNLSKRLGSLFSSRRKKF